MSQKRRELVLSLLIANLISGREELLTWRRKARRSFLMDGESLHSPDELFKIKALKLVQMKQLENSYLLLEYEVKK